jgi:basic membrane protein A
MLKRWLVVLLIVAMGASMVGCNTGDSETAGTEEVTVELTKVALLLSGPISDMSWNAMGYNGLKRIEEEYDNVEISYVESLPKSDYEGSLRAFGEQGFDIIIGHGFSFSDPVTNVAVSYPDSNFVVVGGISQGENVTAVQMDNTQQGFMVGVVAGLITDSNVIGGIGGMNIPPIENIVKGFAAGAKYVNPDIDALLAMTGNYTDANQAKELGLAMMDNGADVLLGAADAASLGVIEAAVEKDIYFIGINSDMRDSAPENIVTAALSDGGIMYTFIFDKYLSGELGGDSYNVGIKEGALALADIDTEALSLSPEKLERLESIIDELAAGTLNHQDLADEFNI